MSTILIALALAMQTAPTPPQQQPRLQDRSGAPPAQERISPAHDLYFEESSRYAWRATPEARRALHEFAGCVARHNGLRAEHVLRLDFTSRRYRDELVRLARVERECFSIRPLSANGLPFAGSLAEHLLLGDPTPLNVRLVRAASQPPTQPFSTTDRMALCVVRSVPDDIARLLATEIGSEVEAEALRALEMPVQVCARGGPRFEVAPVGLRAMFATAAFRMLSAPAATGASG
jgi:hypothetical protein